MSGLDAYTVGGTIHLVVNNQIGFTTGPQRRVLDHLPHRRRAHAADPDHPHQRRGSRGGGPGGRSGGRLPPDASTATSSSTCGATASWATTRPTSPASPSRSCTRPSPAKPSRPRAVYLESLRPAGQRRARRRSPPPTPRPSPASKRQALEEALEAAKKLHAPARPSTFAGVWSRVRGGPDSAVRDVSTGGHRRGARRRSAGRCPPCRRSFTPHPKLVALLKDRAAMAAGREADRLGHGRGAGLRHAAGRGRARAHVRPGRAARHLQPPARGAGRLRRPAHEYTPLEHVARGPGHRSRSATARCPRRACSASNTATAWTCPRGW